MDNPLPQEKVLSFWQEAFQKLFQDRRAIFSSSLLLSLFLFALIGPFLSHYTYYGIQLPLKNLSPCHAFWFGTDELGRDLFTRCWWGARISLSVGLAAALIDLIIGVIWGSVAAIFGGKTEEFLMRICDILSSLPHLLIAILLMVFIGPGIGTILFALTFTGWINMARIVRSHFLSLQAKDFVVAAKTLGASRWHIFFRHLLPNATGPILVTMTLTIPTAIFSEAFLSFLGLGVQAPIASLGVMVNDSIGALRYYPWRLFFPAIIIILSTFSFNLLGEALRSAFDPRRR